MEFFCEKSEWVLANLGYEKRSIIDVQQVPKYTSEKVVGNIPPNIFIIDFEKDLTDRLNKITQFI